MESFNSLFKKKGEDKMKNLKILILLAAMPLMVSCTKIISNPDIQTLNDKAANLMAGGDFKGAIARLESINDLNPSFPQTHYNLGIAYYKDEQYEKSIESFKNAISLDKNIADAYYTTALAYESLAAKQAETLEKSDKKNNKEKQPETAANTNENTEEQKPLTKSEALSQIIDNLNNSKSYFAQYAEHAASSEEKTRIEAEIENIDKDIKKYEEEKTSS